jgi:hypothetical protein
MPQSFQQSSRQLQWPPFQQRACRRPSSGKQQQVRAVNSAACVVSSAAASSEKQQLNEAKQVRRCLGGCGLAVAVERRGVVHHAELLHQAVSKENVLQLLVSLPSSSRLALCLMLGLRYAPAILCRRCRG